MLDEILAAIEAGAFEKAADLLCAQWQQMPSARIARLVALLDARVPRDAGLSGKTVVAREKQWVVRAESLEPETLPALLGVPWPTRAVHAAARIEALAEWPASPRISNALLLLHRQRPWRLSENELTAAGAEIAVRTFEILKDDPSASAYLEELVLDATETTAYERELLATAMRRPRCPEPVFDARTVETVDRIEALLARPDTTREALFAAVYDAPDDDAPRAVLADHLIAIGDQRGELIALQLARPDTTSERERALLRLGGRGWQDGLAEDGARDVSFARGFPVRATAGSYQFRSPAWATVEHLLLAGHRTESFEGSSNLRSVRCLHYLPSAFLARVKCLGAETASRPLEMLTIRGIRELDAPTILQPTVLAFPYDADFGRQWAVSIRNFIERLHHVPIGARVESVVLGIDASEIPFALQLVLSNPRLRDIVLADHSVTRVLSGDRAFTRVSRDRIEIGKLGPLVIEALARITSPPFNEIHIAAPIDAEQSRALDAIVTRWPRAVAISSIVG